MGSSLLSIAAALLCLVASLPALLAQSTITITPALCSVSPCTVTVDWDFEVFNDNYTLAMYRGDNFDADGKPHGLAHIGTVDLTGKKAGDSVTLDVVNLRQNLTFAMMPGSSWAAGTASLAYGVVEFEDYNAPAYGKLALTGKSSEMLLLFTSLDDSRVPTVKLGLNSADDFTETFTGTTEDYFGIDDMCFANANSSTVFYSPGMMNRVLMNNLTTNTVYRYKYGFPADDTHSASWSDVFTFTSSLGKGTKRHTAILVADMGATLPFTPAGINSNFWPSEKSVSLMEELLGLKTQKKLALNKRKFYDWSIFATEEQEEEAHTLAVHIGDLGYARGYPVVWDYFHSNMARITSSVPYMVGIGNHEYDYVGYGQPWEPEGANFGQDSEGECGIPYSRYYEMPAPPEAYTPLAEGKSNTVLRNLWYSFSQGPVHYVMISSEHDFTEGSLQYEFLVQDLSSVDHSVTPWVIVMSHRPMYSSEYVSEGGLQVMALLRGALEPLFIKYDVKLFLCGHVHKYERSCSMKYGKCTTGTAGHSGQGYTQVLIGNAGHTYQNNWIAEDSHHFPPPSWSVFRSFQFGISHMTANLTHLEMAFIGGDAVHDSFVLETENA